jgi:hypothetical protein
MYDQMVSRYSSTQSVFFASLAHVLAWILVRTIAARFMSSIHNFHPYLKPPGLRHMKWRSLLISRKKVLQGDLVNMICYSAVLSIFLTLLRVRSACMKK